MAVKCYCKMSLEELVREMGRINRAHTTMGSGLKALKEKFHRKARWQALFAYLMMARHEGLLQELIGEKVKEREVSET